LTIQDLVYTQSSKVNFAKVVKFCLCLAYVKNIVSKFSASHLGGRSNSSSSSSFESQRDVLYKTNLSCVGQEQSLPKLATFCTLVFALLFIPFPSHSEQLKYKNGYSMVAWKSILCEKHEVARCVREHVKQSTSLFSRGANFFLQLYAATNKRTSRLLK
jgi:hypothetical protein